MDGLSPITSVRVILHQDWCGRRPQVNVTAIMLLDFLIREAPAVYFNFVENPLEIPLTGIRPAEA